MSSPGDSYRIFYSHHPIISEPVFSNNSVNRPHSSPIAATFRELAANGADLNATAADSANCLVSRFMNTGQSSANILCLLDAGYSAEQRDHVIRAPIPTNVSQSIATLFPTGRVVLYSRPSGALSSFPATFTTGLLLSGVPVSVSSLLAGHLAGNTTATGVAENTAAAVAQNFDLEERVLPLHSSNETSPSSTPASVSFFFEVLASCTSAPTKLPREALTKLRPSTLTGLPATALAFL